MSNKIPTAHTFLREEILLVNYDNMPKLMRESVVEAMKKFAKLHVKAALKAAKKKMLADFRDTSRDDDEKMAYEDDCHVFSEDILSAYPPDKIV